MIPLLFIDVDGTLLGAQGVHPRVWAAVERAQGAGMRLALCTGRPIGGVASRYAERLGPGGLHVFESGALVAEPGGRAEWADRVPGATLAAARALAIDAAVPFEIYTPDGRYLVTRRSPFVALHEALLEVQASVVEGEVAAVRGQWLVAEEDWADFEPRARALEGGALHVARSPAAPGIVFCSITSAGCSKAVGAGHLAAALGLSLAQCAAVGDAPNDLELLGAVGSPMAVESAPAAVRAVARRLVPRAEDGGVAEAIEAALQG